MNVDFGKVPQWIFAFAALLIAIAAAYGMFFADCRTQLFGLPFGEDRACSVADSELVERIEQVNRRIDGLKLSVVAVSESPSTGCPFMQAAYPKNLVVMYGSQDGTSCKIGNKNFYKELSLDVPARN